jgi:phenylpyruvate tautomerase PptA (4-oxalocrotonate tautomerase family)
MLPPAEKEKLVPTYVCSVPPSLLDPSQKTELAKAITNRHSQATGAPPFFVQVVIREDQTEQRYLGGEPTSNHIWIRADIRAGRTEKQRAAMMLNILNDVNRISKVPRESIWVYVCNLAPTDMIEYGNILPNPGDEAAWFACLPLSLQKYFILLGTTKDTFTL